MNLISRRAAAAKEVVEHYPSGDAAEWARRNWTQSVRPYMEEFVSAVKRRTAEVPEGYFDETGTLFIFTDVKAMFALADAMREMPAREKAAVISEVFVPYGDKWQELLAAIQGRIGACAETRAFRTKLVQVADTVKLMFVERGLASHVDTVFDLRRGMVEAFAKLRDKVCAATSGPRAPRTRLHYCLPNSELVEIFGVNIRTIVRWKDTRNQSEDAKLFRAARENERAMYEAARIYRAAHPEKDQKSSQESFNETTDYSRRRIG